MRGITLAAAALVLLGTGVRGQAQDVSAGPGVELAVSPPASWLQGDPADSLYKLGREALNRSRFREAASTFRQIRERYPRSGYTPDALYWEAFALYRLGGRSSLRQALSALEMQSDRYPQASTRGDGEALRTRITAALARSGDAESAQEITAVAAAAAAPVAQPAEPVTAAAPRVRPGRAPKPARAPRASRHDECDNEDDTKAIALNALLQMDAERAVPILEKVLARRDSASTCLRRRAMFLISQKQTDRTDDILLNAARTDPDPEVRQQAVFWLSQVNSDQAIAALESILGGSTDPEMQEKALFALSQQQSPRASAILRAFAERESAPAELRGRAIFWMGQKGGDNSAYLRTLYGKVRDAELREQILFSVSQAGGQANGDWLLGIAKNGQEPIELRKRALFWAGQGSASIGELVRLYDGITDREMREQLVFVYSQRNEREAMDKMIDIARRDPDQEIRKRALFWISQSKDPRATQLIQDILED